VRRPVSHGIEVRIDTDTCMGSGNCSYWAPESFDLADDGHAVVLDPDKSDEERLWVVAEGCPVAAISLWRAGQRLEKGAS